MVLTAALHLTFNNPDESVFCSRGDVGKKIGKGKQDTQEMVSGNFSSVDNVLHY